MNVPNPLMQLLRETRAATAVEYSLLVAMIAMAIMFTVRGFATETNIMWTRVGSTMQQATGS